MIERTYTIPLRSGFREAAKHKKTKKAVSVLKSFLSRHMHSDKVLIGKNLNQELWKHGIKNPPHHVKVSVVKEDDGTVKAELFGHKYEHKKKEQKDSKDQKDSKEKTAEVDASKKESKENKNASEAKKVSAEKNDDTKSSEHEKAEKTKPAKKPTASKK
jgi:large subunit ribosomal protein L31e